MKLISVVVPVFNAEPYLDRCIDSIINQTYKNLEIILVNDGSTDQSLSICEAYARQDKRVKVINKSGGGVSSARNAGLNIASGELVCFFDSDDYVEADFIEKLCEGIADNDICIGGYISDLYDVEEKLIKREEILLGINAIDDSFPLDNHGKLFALCMSLCNKVYNLKLIQKYNLRFDEKVSFGEDGLFNADFFLLTKKISFLHYAGYHYIRRKRQTLSAKFYDDFLWIKFRALKRRCEVLMHWGLSQEKIESYRNMTTFKLVWTHVSSIKSQGYSQKLKEITNNQEIIYEIKRYKPINIKDWLKKMIVRIKIKV